MWRMALLLRDFLRVFLFFFEEAPFFFFEELAATPFFFLDFFLPFFLDELDFFPLALWLVFALAFLARVSTGATKAPAERIAAKRNVRNFLKDADIFIE